MPIAATRAILRRPNQLELERVALPPLAPDEALIRTTRTLISPGTERALLLNLPGRDVMYPKAVGYSHVGQVVELGESVTNLRIGDRVASKSRHASYVIAKAADCHALDAALDDEAATFFQLLATALQGVRKTRLEIGEGAAIVGAGLVGNLALQVSRAAGAMPTVVVDRQAGRLKLARQLGADLALDADEALDAIEGGCPVVVEATGNPAALELACKIAAFGGRVVLLGSARGKSEDFDFYQLVHRRGLRLIGAHINTGDRPGSAPGWWTLRDEQRTALELLRHGRVNVAPLITHRFGYGDIPAAYELLSRWDMDALGIVIDWT